MEYKSLQALARSYRQAYHPELTELANQYQARSDQEVLDIAAVAADVSVDSILNLGLDPDSNPLLIEAFRLQYPNVDLGSLAGASSERLEGLGNGVKGKYFEVLVRHRLNSGERVGELALGPGQVARLADSPTQEGWDLEIVTAEDGSVIEVIQLKATADLSYVKEALERYRDIRVATPSDIDGAAEEILQTDISHDELTEAVRSQLGELSEDVVTDILHQTAEWAFDSVPLLPAVFVVIHEGRTVLLRRSSLQQALQRGARRIGRAATFSTLGATLVALDAGIVSVPTTTAARIAWSRIGNRMALKGLLQTRTEEIRLLTAA